MHINNNTKSICSKCLEYRFITRHHIFPKRFFKKTKKAPILMLCQKCHQEIEDRIPRHIKLSKQDYIALTIKFLKEGENVKSIRSRKNTGQRVVGYNTKKELQLYY